MFDNPEENASSDFDTYFYRKIKAGFSVVSDDKEKWSQITSIIEDSGISVTKPKAELHMAVVAQMRPTHEASLQVDITNPTSVTADHAQVRIDMDDEGGFLSEPEGSSPDVTGRKSARMFTFDSVGPHSGRTLTLEVSLTHLLDDAFFFVTFGYGCPTCAFGDTFQTLKCDARQSRALCTTAQGVLKGAILGLPRSESIEPTPLPIKP
jgi:hypothetical protein